MSFLRALTVESLGILSVLLLLGTVELSPDTSSDTSDDAQRILWSGPAFDSSSSSSSIPRDEQERVEFTRRELTRHSVAARTGFAEQLRALQDRLLRAVDDGAASELP